MKKYMAHFWVIPFLLGHLMLYQNCGQQAVSDTTQLSAPQSLIKEQGSFKYLTQLSVQCKGESFELYAPESRCLKLEDFIELAKDQCGGEVPSVSYDLQEYCGSFSQKSDVNETIVMHSHVFAKDFTINEVEFKCLDGIVHNESFSTCLDLESVTGLVYDTCISSCSGRECGVNEILSFEQCKM